MKNDELKDILLQQLMLHRQLTRREFLDTHPVRPASMLAAVNELKAAGWVVEPDRLTAKTGRRSPALHLNPEWGAMAGIELQPHKMLGVLIDANENLLADVILDFPGGITANAIPGKLMEVLEALRNRQPRHAPPWRGIGFADPGLVDVINQKSLRAHNVSGWQAIPIGDWLRDLSKVEETFIVPETMARTFAEYFQPRKAAPDSLCLVELDTGIGGGFMKNGRLFVGSSSRGMELGHLVIKPGGPLCKCGNQGCLEAIAGAYGISQRISDMIANKVTTELKATDGIEDFVASVYNHDRAAGLLASEICDAVAQAVTVVVTMLNPEVIVFSGRLAKLDSILLDTVRRALNVNCFYGAIEKLQLEISQLDEYAAARGAALLMRSRLLRPEASLWF